MSDSYQQNNIFHAIQVIIIFHDNIDCFFNSVFHFLQLLALKFDTGGDVYYPAFIQAIDTGNTSLLLCRLGI